MGCVEPRRLLKTALALMRVTILTPSMAAHSRLIAMSDPSAVQQPNSDEEGERLVLAAAEAIRNLAADRGSLRNKVAAQERELIRLRASNAELWRHVALVRDSYRRLATGSSLSCNGWTARSAPRFRLSTAPAQLPNS